MKTAVKTKPSDLSAEVRGMIDVRHQAEQRGHYEILGRLVVLETAHGLIEFPAEHGEWAGPDIGIVCAIGGEVLKVPMDGKLTTSPSDSNILIVLGAWPGLPALRHTMKTPRLDRLGKPIFTGEDGRAVSFDTPGAKQVFDHVACPDCLHVCDICAGVGMKQCNFLNCGGRGWYPGKWLSCPGPGCRKDTGQFKPGCATCATSAVQGLVPEEIKCEECNGTGQMICDACRGKKKRSTGHVNGSLDYRLPACAACGGTGRKGKWVRQDVSPYVNAIFAKHLALGPIHSFTIKDLSTARLRLFEVSQDAAGDFLMLLAPKAVHGNSRAYLVGGVVNERVAQKGEVA